MYFIITLNHIITRQSIPHFKTIDSSLFQKEESAAKIQEAEAQGNQLANEVTSNFSIMESVHDNLATVTNDSLQVRLFYFKIKTHLLIIFMKLCEIFCICKEM